MALGCLPDSLVQLMAVAKVGNTTHHSSHQPIPVGGMAKKGKAKNGAAPAEGDQVSAPVSTGSVAAPVAAPVAAAPVRPAATKEVSTAAPVKEVKLDVKPVAEKKSNAPKAPQNGAPAIENGSDGETGELKRKRSRRNRKKKSDESGTEQNNDKQSTAATVKKNLRKKRSKLLRALEQAESNTAPKATPEGKTPLSAEDLRRKIQVVEKLLEHLQAQTQEEQKKVDSLKGAKPVVQPTEAQKKTDQPKAVPKTLNTEKARKEAEAKKLASEKAEIQNEAKRLVQEKARKEQEMRKLLEEKAKKDAEAKQLLEEKAAREAELAKLTQAKARVETVEQKINEIDQKVQQRKDADEAKVAPGSPKQKKEQAARTRKDSESSKKKEAEEKTKKEAEEKAKKEAEEKAKKEAAEKAKKEAEEKAKKEAAEKAKKEAEEKAKKEAAEKAKKEAEEKAKKEAEEKAKKEAAEKAKREAEEKAKKEAAEKAKKEAEEKAKKEAAEKAKKEAEEKAKKEAAEKAKKEAEEKAKKEAAEKAKKEAEEKAKKEAAEKAKKEAEEKAKKEAAEKAKKDAEEKAKKEAAEKAKKEAEEKAKKEAEEKAKKETAEKAKKETEEKAKQEAAEKVKKQAEEEAKRKTNGEVAKQQQNGSTPTNPAQEKPSTPKLDPKNKKNNRRTPKNSVSEDEKNGTKATGPKNGPGGDFASSAEPVSVAKSQESQSAPVPIPKTPEVAAASSPKPSPKSAPAPKTAPAPAPVAANAKSQTAPAKTPEKTAARSSPPKTTAKAPSPPRTAPARAAPPKPSTPPATKKPEPPPKPEFLKKKSPSVEKEKVAKVTAPQQVSQTPAAAVPSSAPASTPATPATPATVPTPAPAAPQTSEPASSEARLTEEALNGTKKPAAAAAAAAAAAGASKAKPQPPKKPEVPPKPDVHNKSAAKMKTPIKQPGGKASTVKMTSGTVQNKHLTTIQSDCRSPAPDQSRAEAFKKNMDIISTIADVLLSYPRSKRNRGSTATADGSEPTNSSANNTPSASVRSPLAASSTASASASSLLSSLFPSSSSGGSGSSASHQAGAPKSTPQSAETPKPKSKIDLERILRILQSSQGAPRPEGDPSSSSSTPPSAALQELPEGSDPLEGNPFGSFLTKDAIRMLMPTLQEVNVKFNVEKQLEALNATAAMAKILPKTLPPGTDTTEEDELEEDLMDEESEDTIEYKFTPRPVFIATICQVCKNPLKSFFHCERCKMVSYCGEDHRRTDEPAHRELCAVLCETAANRGGHLYQLARKLNVQEYRNLRVHTLNQIELSLRRPMQAFEREIVLFPRICLAPDCREWRQELLIECTDCRQVSYCAASPEHLLASHRRWCKAYLLFQKLILRQRILGRIEPVLPVRIVTKPTPLPTNVDEVFKQLYKNSTVPRDECVYAVLSQIATAPLTALHAYQQTGKPFGSTFTIHLVGAELQFEGDTLDKWEAFFLHLVPEVAVLRVVFVGPELNVENLPIDVISRIRMCRTCRMKCRVVAFDFQCRTMYHDYRHSSRYQRPNLICFFNPGLHRTTGYAGLDSWPTTIRAATEAGCPMVVTAYTELESPLDLDRLQRESTRTLQIVQAPSVNPFGSKRPDRNFISDETAPMIFKNYYYFVVQ
uniref:MYND-type domain-containing protein n=1 Tax=Anopheles farauti TaxID=69004 RepID=A0A182Q307_9DIPT